ncbi:MAG: APC family permease [Candidatus Micrarchaeota archaeon]|nr:APC family permease [Candidatus Micrarchaeota archaeon]
MQNKIEKSSIPDYLLYGFAIASVGGPLALVMLNFFNTSYIAGSSAYSIYTVLIGILLFVAPLAIWYRYSKHIVSSGGLYTFVKRTFGERAAKVQGWTWLFSYFLYLPYTVIYISHELLPVIFPNITYYLPLISIALAFIIIALMLTFRKTLYLIAATAVLQLLIILGILFYALSRGIVYSASSSASLASLTTGSLATSLLFICASLPLFLGGEVKEGSRSVRKALVVSFVIASIFFLIGSIALLSFNSQRISSEFPGLLALKGSMGNSFAYFVAVAVLISLIDLVIIEFIAITRVSYAMLGLNLSKTWAIISVLFILVTMIGIAYPSKFYNYSIIASLAALFASQLIVFVAYPFFAKKKNELKFSDILITFVSCILMLYGLYTLIVQFI